ncbi:ABC transporter substrate-binding protein [Umezawaea sp. Da 62-37]|uniref:ABC transporter substrate-binding protein n=1 Tax=Umezawaea sp. Da 62-37 TaxID=3075927 RepID=UPI0028F6FECA|nr:ABC transporter substrate-binding protein [Umezawaea sp. Da 62-37]WNV88035.1 ABC transporter substrate-binding protein [Umezawaea sp. Da 62-37]
MTRFALAALLVLATTFGFPNPALAQGSQGFCPDASGITVVVDFQELGGSTIVRCATGDQATGLAALKNSGIGITGTQRWGEGFICRIEGKPAANSEACIDTPPARAYWSYWHASNGGAWTYSDKGVINRKPPAGSFEGWSFSLDKTETTNPPPRVAPVRPVAAPTTTKPPVVPPPGAPVQPGAPAQPGSPAQPGKPAPGTPAAPGAVTTTTPPASTPTSGSASASASVGPSTSGEPAAAPSTTDSATWSGEVENTAAEDRSNSPVGALVGAGAVLLLAIAGGVVGFRRRRAADR